jgi:acetate kinase
LRVLIVNAGSSSLKLSYLDENDALLAGEEVEAPRGRFDEAAVAKVVNALEGVEAVGHRVVHGGPRFSEPARVTPRVISYLHTLTDLAPLHLPAALAGMEAVKKLLPRTPAVACFDTGFHSRMPAPAATYAVPGSWRKRYGIRRYGFHGFSHAYSARRAAEMVGHARRELRTVTCHLGAGASLAAVWGGRSVDTTMGFTPLEGLVMATRAGTVDPGMLLWLQRHAGMTERMLTEALEHHSGLVALAGTADMRQVLKRASTGDEKARLALDVYVHRLCAGVAAMAAAMGGLDALVFTGGVGEKAPAVRAAAASKLRFLGIEIDSPKNRRASGDADVSAVRAGVRTLVVHAREDVEVAKDVWRALSESR